jgi:hypothetical protein
MLASMNTTDAIITGDCLAVLPTLAAGVADMAYFDPPFGIGMDYPDYDDSNPDLALIESTLRELTRVLSPFGSMWVQCGQTIQAEVFLMLVRLGLHWRNSVVWHYEFGPQHTQKFSPCWQMLHWFTVHPKRFTFNADDIRVPSKRQTEYDDKRAAPEGRSSAMCGTSPESPARSRRDGIIAVRRR